MQDEDVLRRRRIIQPVLQRGLHRPQLFAPGESAGIPDFLRGRSPLVQPSDQPLTQPIQPPPVQPVTQPVNPGLTLPQPDSSPFNPGVTPPPAPTEPAAPRSSPRVGYSTAGLAGVDALRQRRKALEEADPESKVTQTGEILPPEKIGRWTGLGQGALLGLGQADPDRPMYALGQMLGGATTGAISPRSSAKGMRKFELDRLDNDLARGLKLEAMQGEADRARNPIGQMSTRVVGKDEYPGIEEGTEIRVRIDPRTGAVTDVVGPNSKPVVSESVKRPAAGAPHYEKDADGYLLTVQGGKAQRVTDADGKPVQVKKGGNDEEYVEVEVNGRKLRVSPGQALGYYGQIGAQENKQAVEQSERQAKWQAADDDYQSLLTEEEAAKTEKDRAYQVLDQVRKSVPNDEIGRQDLRQAEDAAQQADKNYQSYADKKREARRRMQENQVTIPRPMQSGGANEDPQVRRYADQFFGGDYAAAQAAIKQQRGQ